MFRLLLCLLVLTAPTFAKQSQRSWWVNYKPVTESKTYGLIQAQQLHPDFVSLSVFSCDKPSSFTQKQCKDIKQSGALLDFTGDFNQDGIVENWHLGVAKSKNGLTSQILFATDSNGLLIHSLHIPSNTHFSSLFVKEDGRLLWSMCLYCGDFAELKWSQGQWLLEWNKEYG